MNKSNRDHVVNMHLYARLVCPGIATITKIKPFSTRWGWLQPT